MYIPFHSLILARQIYAKSKNNPLNTLNIPLTTKTNFKTYAIIINECIIIKMYISKKKIVKRKSY